MVVFFYFIYFVTIFICSNLQFKYKFLLEVHFLGEGIAVFYTLILNNIMKKIFTLMVGLTLFNLGLSAQNYEYDPSVSDISFDVTEVEVGKTATFSVTFNVAETVAGEDPFPTSCGITLTINPPTGSTALYELSEPTGPGAVYFDWVNTNGLWKGTQNQEIGDGDGGLITSTATGLIVGGPNQTSATYSDGFSGCISANDGTNDYLTTELEVIEATPVTLKTFTATPAVTGTSLKWNTVDEVAFDKFVIEKSFENVAEFASITEVKGGSTNYNYLDGNVSVGTSYYRLKMVDLDGTFKYSPIVSVTSEFGVGEHIVYPNPTANRVVKVKNYFAIDSYNVSDLSGKSVGVTLTSNAAAHEFTISNSATNGIYILEYTTNGKKVSRKFAVQ